MDEQQQDLLRILLVTRTFNVYQSRTGSSGARRLSQGPGGPRFVNMDALLGSASARSQVVSILVDRLHQHARRIRGVSSVPYGCEWLAAMAADRMSVPLLMPTWVTDAALATVHGAVQFGSSVWIIDADPDSEDDDRLLHAAEVIGSSRTVGCQVAGAIVLFERNGRTRSTFLERYPQATFISLLQIRDALALIATGMFASLVDPKDAVRSLRLLDDAASVPRTPKTPSNV